MLLPVSTWLQFLDQHPGNDRRKRTDFLRRWLAMFFPLLLCFILAENAAPQMNDMEKEFFEGMEEMEEDYRRFEKEAFEEFRREVEAMWGDFTTSTKKDWVEYSEDKTGRRQVDFETGEVVVEVIVSKKKAETDPHFIKERLQGELEQLVADKGKTRDYNLPAKAVPDAATTTVLRKEIPPAPLMSTPVLGGQLQDKEGKPVSEENKKEFAKEVVETESIVKEELRTEKGEVVKAQVRIALVPDHIKIRAEKYLDPVRMYAERFKISVPLAFAVIHTESFFNPKAKSPVPAFGLMQIVPKSGGYDAYQYVYGKGKIVSADYLYQAKNNIELGCAYIGLLKNRYFRKVRQPENALLCAIASYNTGAGNLSRALCGKKVISCAVERANTMTSEELYTYLRANLPYKETQGYLKKVTERMSLYVKWE